MISLAALTKNLQKAYEKQNKEVIAALEPQVKTAKENLAAHVDMLRKQYPLFAATKYPEPMGLDQTGLKDNEWVLAYHVTDPGIIIYLTRGKNLVKGCSNRLQEKRLTNWSESSVNRWNWGLMILSQRNSVDL